MHPPMKAITYTSGMYTSESVLRMPGLHISLMLQSTTSFLQANTVSEEPSEYKGLSLSAAIQQESFRV